MLEKIKLRESPIYREYDFAQKAFESFYTEHKGKIFELSALAMENPNCPAASDPIIIEFSRLEADMSSKLTAYSNYVSEVYARWFEDLKTADVSVPGKTAYNALADALIQQEEQGHIEEKQRELEDEVRRRRDILNIVFETHIAEF